MPNPTANLIMVLVDQLISEITDERQRILLAAASALIAWNDQEPDPTKKNVAKLLVEMVQEDIRAKVES